MGIPPQELVHEARLPDPPPHGDETAAARLPHPAQLGLQGRHVSAPADEVAHILFFDALTTIRLTFMKHSSV